MINTENKNWWVKEGYKYELKFIDFCKNKLKMNIKMKLKIQLVNHKLKFLMLKIILMR